MNYKTSFRKNLSFISETRRRLNVPAIGLFIVSIGGYSIAFLALRPNSSFIWEKTLVVNPYDVINLSLVLILISVLVWMGINIVWVIAKYSPPLINVDVFTPLSTGGTPHIRIQSNDSVEFESIVIELLSIDDPNWGDSIHTKRMGGKKTIEIKKNIGYGDTVEIPFMKSRDKDVLILVDGGGYSLPMVDEKVKYLDEEFEVLFQIRGLTANEKLKKNIGIYSGRVVHIWRNGFEVEMDGETYINTQNYIAWKEGSFRKIEDKKELKSLSKLAEGLPI